MGHFGEQLTSIALAIVGVAIVAVIVSNRSNTSSVISASANAFAGALSTAVSPITGNVASSSGGFTGSLGIPQLRTGIY